MDTSGLNITKICNSDIFTLNETETDLYFSGICDEPPTVLYTETPPLPPTTGFVVYFSMLIFGGIILNLLVVFTIFSRTRLRTVPNAFMVSLSVADFLMATVAIPLRLIELVDEKDYVITSLLFPFIGVASIFSLCCVTLDRYIHIRHPLDYEKHMNKSRAIAIVCCVWIFSILQSSIFFFVNDSGFKEAIYNDVRLFCCFCIPATFIIVAYTKLFLIAKGHARVIATTAVTIPHPDRPWSQKKDYKILKVIALIVGTFLLCWFPFLVAVSYELHTENSPSSAFYWFLSISESLACSTCVLNPVIYGFLRRDLRISMRYVAVCKRESIEESESL